MLAVLVETDLEIDEAEAFDRRIEDAVAAASVASQSATQSAAAEASVYETPHQPRRVQFKDCSQSASQRFREGMDQTADVTE